MRVLTLRDVVEWNPAFGTEALAILATEQRLRQGEGDRVMGPSADVELIPVDVWTRKLLVVTARLIHLARLDLHLELAGFETTHAAAAESGVEGEAQGVARRRPRNLQACRHLLVAEVVGLSAQLEPLGAKLEIEAPALPRLERQRRQIDRVEWPGHATNLGKAMTERFHWDPETYLGMIHEEVPRYDELQEAAVAAVPFAPARILELGFGTAETTQRLLDRFPETRITGLDSSSDMVFKARELGWEDLRLGRIEDPLPDGPWDLVIAVLTVHHLQDDGKRELFRRVREQSRSLVIGDIVDVPEAQRVTPIEENWDYPASAADQAGWCGGEVVWERDDLAVIRATYG